MLLIYSLHVTPRLQYIADLIFRDLLEIEIEFTTSTDKFKTYEGPKLCYHKEQISDGVHIYPHTILFEKDIHIQRMDFDMYEDIVVLFSNHDTSDLPYDPLAAAFFLVSRYEEYMTFKADSYGRFRGEKSTAYSKAFHTVPVVNYYALHLKKLLQYKYAELTFSSKEYQFVLTYDIDLAFKYLERGPLRSLGATVSAMFKQDWNYIAERKKVLAGEMPDPFDTFDEQLRLSEKYRIYPVYFLPTGNYGAFDKNIPWTSKRLKEMIKKVTDRFLVGLHPSYASNNNPRMLEMEIARLNALSGKPVIRSRQHFLKLSFPDTYRMLMSQGIQEDWTLGHASILGFRASIASPFFFYDLQKEEQTNLRIYPFAAMDSTLFYYQNLTAQSALDELKQVVDEVKKVNGTFIFISHNDLIGPNSVWPGWNKCFEEFIVYARE